MSSLSPADLNILLVEPSAMQRKVIRNELFREGVEAIDEVASIEDAIKRIHAVRPDLVICSLHFPDGSGLDLLQHIRQNKELSDMPFMLVSSETRHKELDKFKQAGVVAILPKPFTHEHLGVAINSTLDLLTNDELELEYYDAEALRILLVDDSRMARNVIRRVLENLNITHITEAADGSEAIQLLPAGFDLIVTDYNMPEVNGLELAEYIRSSGDYAHLPILMVTSEASHAHLSNVAKSGVNAMTDKPFEPATVKQILIRLLNE